MSVDDGFKTPTLLSWVKKRRKKSQGLHISSELVSVLYYSLIVWYYRRSCYHCCESGVDVVNEFDTVATLMQPAV